MPIPLTSNYGIVFVHRGVKLQNLQPIAKNAPNCIPNFKILPGVTSRTPIPGLSPRLMALGHSMVLAETNGWIKPCLNASSRKHYKGYVQSYY